MKTSLHPYYQLLYFSISGVMLCLSFLALIGLHTSVAKEPITRQAASSEVPTTISPAIAEGKALFLQNCAQCHAKDMKTRLTAPALAGVSDRWADYPRTDLYAWIRNSQALVETKHPRATALWQEWNRMVMPSYNRLTDEQIEALLEYIGSVGK